MPATVWKGVPACIAPAVFSLGCLLSARATCF